jgi:hypothetical protein
MRGATRLLELRGVDQLKRPQGLQMFTHLRTQIVRNWILPLVDISILVLNLWVEFHCKFRLAQRSTLIADCEPVTAYK